MSVWAHNLHIANEGNNMGKNINQTYQEKYRTVGFSFAEGSVSAVNMSKGKLAYNVFDTDVKEKYINQLFSQASSPNYIVKMEGMFADESLRTYFMSKPFFQIGAAFYSPFETNNFTTLKAYNFTYIIHINTSTHSDSYLLTP
jgi:erythromycin esterase-like protein